MHVFGLLKDLTLCRPSWSLSVIQGNKPEFTHQGTSPSCSLRTLCNSQMLALQLEKSHNIKVVVRAVTKKQLKRKRKKQWRCVTKRQIQAWKTTVKAMPINRSLVAVTRKANLFTHIFLSGNKKSRLTGAVLHS